MSHVLRDSEGNEIGRSATPIVLDGTAARSLDETWLNLPGGCTVTEEPDQAPLPEEVDRWRAHYVLAAAGLMPAVRAAIAAIEDDTERAVAEVLFDQRPTIRRISTLTQQIQLGAGVSDEDRDSLFLQAAAL